MAPSSSTKKAAKLTQRGKGRTVRFQGGTLFPFIVALVVVLGVGTVVYARQSQPSADASPPTINHHWHAAYGFYICGEWYQLDGDKEIRNAAGQLVSTNYLQTGVHSHDDGVIHWHAFTSRAVGRRATLGVFLDVYEVEFTNEVLRFPEDQDLGPPWGAGAEFIPGETQCDGEDAELSMVVWGSFNDTGPGVRYIANFENVRIQGDGMVFALAFMPRGEAVPMPPWAPQLPALGAIDYTQFTPQDLVDAGLLPEDFDPSIFPEVDLEGTVYDDGEDAENGGGAEDTDETGDGDGDDQGGAATTDGADTNDEG